MLDSTDREFIRKEIKKLLRQDNGEVAAEKEKHVKKQVKQETMKTIAEMTSSIKKSQLGKGAINALVYSNPVTAALANNFDLISGVSKGVGKLTTSAIKALKQNISKKSNVTTNSNKQNSLLPTTQGKNKLPNNIQKFISNGSTNYVLAKNAMFVGGKNYININMPNNKYGSFGTNTNKHNELTSSIVDAKISSQNRLNLPRGPVIEGKFTEMSTKISKSQLTEMKTTNKLLTVMNKRTMLIVGGVLLGVGAIAALASFIYNKFKIGKPAGTAVNASSQSNLFKQQSFNTKLDTINKINEGIQNEAIPTNIDKFNKITTIGDKSIDTGLRSGYTAQSKEGSVYRAPFDMKIKSFKENNRKLGVINIIAEKRSSGIDKDIEIMNITNPVVYPEQIVKKNQPIGLIGPGGNIHIKDISKKDFDEYINNINKYAQSQDKQQFDISDNDQQQINSYFNAMSYYKQMQPNKDVVVDKNSKKYIDEQNNINQNRNTQAIQTLQDAIDNNYNGTSLHGRWVPKEDLQTELNKYKSQYNKINKNAEIATSQSLKASPNNGPKIVKQQPQPETKPNNITISQGTNRTKCYGLSFPMDIAAANCDIFTV